MLPQLLISYWIQRDLAHHPATEKCLLSVTPSSRCCSSCPQRVAGDRVTAYYKVYQKGKSSYTFTSNHCGLLLPVIDTLPFGSITQLYVSAPMQFHHSSSDSCFNIMATKCTSPSLSVKWCPFSTGYMVLSEMMHSLKPPDCSAI